MKKNDIILIVRIIILNILLFVGVIGIFGTPSDDLPMMKWIIVLIISKVIGFGAIIMMIAFGDIWLGRFLKNKEV